MRMLLGGAGAKKKVWKPNKIEFSKNLKQIFGASSFA